MGEHAFRSGAEIANLLGGVSDAQVQPNGVDVTAAKMEMQVGEGKIELDGKQIAQRTEMAPEDGSWYVKSPMIVQYGETIEIPENHIGFVYPRSSLLRNSCMLYTAVWDAGYTGKGEGLIVPHTPIEIEQGARIGQIVYATADHEDTYDGSYQGEGLENGSRSG